jgi:peptide/nickel transport system substrate-binding protein
VWTGPDFAHARELIAEAGVAGTEIELTTISQDPFPAVGEYIVTVLEEIGLPAELTVLDGREFGAAAFDQERPMMSGLIVWFPDYPLPSSFIEPNFACSSLANLPRFCDPALDERMQQALDLQTTDPAGAAAIWAELDAAITEQAPWAPLITFNTTAFVSERVGSVQSHPQWGILLDQLWVE